MLQEYLDHNQHNNTDQNTFDVNQKKIDPVAQLKWINNSSGDQGFGIYGDNQPAQMFTPEEGKQTLHKTSKDLFQDKEMLIKHNPLLEKEADVMGDKIAQGKMVNIAGNGSGVQSKKRGKPIFENKPTNKTVPPEFSPYIDFIAAGSKEAGYTVSSNSVGPILPVGENLLDEFSTGIGPTNRVFLGDSPMTIALKNARMVEYAKFFFYKKYKNDIQNDKPLSEASVTDYKGSFGFSGLLLAGFDIAEQYVGSFTVDIFAINEGKDIVIRVTNSTSMTSAGYRMTDEYHRDSEKKTPGGNTYQIYIWKEKIDSKAFFKEHYKIINEIDWSKYGSGIK